MSEVSQPRGEQTEFHLHALYRTDQFPSTAGLYKFCSSNRVEYVSSVESPEKEDHASKRPQSISHYAHR